MKTTSPKQFIKLAAALLFAGSLTGQAAHEVAVEYALPLHLKAEVNTTDCNNSQGPQVTLKGAISLGALQMRLICRNNLKGTHTATVDSEADVTLIPLGGAISIPKQPVRGGVGGNPHISLQFIDAAGNSLANELYLGRCVQGLKVTSDLATAATVITDISAADCSNQQGPILTLNGSISLDGLRAKFIFRNSVKGRHTAEVVRDVTLVPKGWTITIPKQPVQGGVGGNPWISVQFVGDDDEPLDDETLLGRCHQL